MELPPCYLIYPYFENPEMLKRQVENWNRLGGDLRRAIRIVVVDDHSIKYPALPIMEELNCRKTLFRMMEPGIWGMHEARNVGLMKSIKEGNDPTWALMSDIDLMITPEMLMNLLTKKLDYGKHYTFERKMAPDFTPRNYHCNSYLLNHKAYYAINGYDVDFTGTFGGGYGGDGEFARQLSAITPRVHLDNVYLIGHERDAVPDANTTEWDREEWKKKYRTIFDKKRRTGDMRSIKPIRRKVERLL